MSPLLAPDSSQIERELDKLLKGNANARVLGMRSPTQRGWPDVIERGGRRFRLAWCPSELEVRERLDEAETEGPDGVVLLTPLDPTSLGGDIMARMPGGRLRQSDRWAVLRNAFQVRDVDPRLRAQRWLADLLIECSPVGGYSPAAGGMLDLDTAWRAVQEQVLGLEAGRSDVATLLEWSIDFTKVERFRGLPDAARRAVVQRLTGAGGASTGLVLSAAAAGRGDDALPIGLICGVIFGEAEPRAELRDAAVRLEPLVGGAQVTPEAGRVLAIAAHRALTRLIGNEPAKARAAQLRAVVLLSEVRADSAAALSPALDLGLDARIKDAAVALAMTALSGNGDDAARAWHLAQHAAAHDRADDQRARVDRLIMAARLACWLAALRPPAPRGMAEASAAYVRDSGYADRARHALQSGDGLPEVAAAYAKLREAATVRREDENLVFATTLVTWNKGGASGSDPIPIEKVLDAVVAPLARGAPILVLVLDGLSFATWRALAETLPRLGWIEFRPHGRATLPTAVAVLPSVTEVSRASLLCGTLRRGDQATERAGFAAHSGLLAASRAGRPPRLYHKSDLGPGPELAETVRDAVADPQQRVVGVVHNAVDAQLAGSDQIELTWSAEGLRQIAALLRVARDAGRVVVVTGDHGHVVEETTTLRSGGTGDRWRASGPAEDGEIALSGGRVLSPDGGQSIVAAWSERVRYATRRSGYHGGVSPQEVLVPIAVLGASDAPSGWAPAPPAEPPWWRGTYDEALITVPLGLEVSSFPPAARRRPADVRQPELFGVDLALPVRETPQIPPWIAALVASDIYAAQRRLAGRGAPTDEQVLLLLRALITRGGRLSRTGLAQSLSMPALRVGGIVNAARRLLNLDQAQVLAQDGDDVVLDERLLRVQFDLGKGS